MIVVSHDIDDQRFTGAWVSDGWDDVNLGRTQFEFGTVSLYVSSLQTCTVRFQCECNSSGLRHCHLACDTFRRLEKKSQKLHTMSTLWQSHTVTKMVCEVKGSTSKDWLQIASAIVLLPLADVVAISSSTSHAIDLSMKQICSSPGRPPWQSHVESHKTQKRMHFARIAWSQFPTYQARSRQKQKKMESAT